MRKSACAIFILILVMTFSCDSVEGTFEGSVPNFYTLTTNVLPQQGGTVQPASGEYLEGNSVQIIARPAEGYVFDYWEGDYTGSSNPVVIQFESNRTVTANFSLRDYDLNIEIVGNGAVNETVIERSTSVTVSLTAEAENGWLFDRWEGDLTGSSNPETIIIEEDEEKSVTAVFLEEIEADYSLNVSIEGEGSVNREPDKSSYAEGEEVTLTASAASGWSFKEWSGDLSGNTNPVTITFDDDKNVTAIFEQDLPEEYTLTINTVGDGSVDKNPDKDIYIDGDEVTLTANAATGWLFKEWSGDLSGNTNPETITLDDDKNVTAIFEQGVPEQYTLTISTDGNGSVDKNPNRQFYIDGDEVTLTANATSGWSFIEWTGDLSGSTNPQTIVMDEDKQITAIFEQDTPEEYTLTISTEGAGSVNKNPNRQFYIDGDEVTLTANAAFGWSFKEWTGDLSGSANPQTIVMDEDKQITAIFEIDPDLGITINEVKLYIKEMELGGARTTSDFKTKDFILNLPLNGTPFHITHVQIPAGFYDELELDIKKPSNSVDFGDPDFINGSNRYSLVVNGIFNGVDFTFQSDEEFQIDVDFSPHLRIASGQTSVIAITVDFEGWFMGENNIIMDPNDPMNTNQINNNIEDSFSDFEDDF